MNNRKDISISDETRQKVFDAAKQLNYTPNQLARSLKTNQSKLIGLIIPTITNSFYPMLTQHIEEYAASRGYNILLCNTYRKVENEEFYLNLLAEKSVDGFDNIYLSKVIRPGITTVDHHTSHRSKLAIDILINRIGNDIEDVYRVKYEPRLIARDSTGPI